MVEPQIVILVVAGSSPVDHPALQVPNPKSQATNSFNLAYGNWYVGLEIFDCVPVAQPDRASDRSEEHTSELQSQSNIVCRLLLEKKSACCATEQARQR